MSNFNPNNYQQHVKDGLCSIEMLKSLVDSPFQVPSTLFMFSNLPKMSMEYNFMEKYLEDIYNPPDSNLQLSKQRQQDLHTMRPQDISQIYKAPVDRMKVIVPAKKPMDKPFQPDGFPKPFGFPTPTFPPFFPKGPPLFPPFPNPSMPMKGPQDENKGINAKRKPQNPTAAPLFEYGKKKVKPVTQEKTSLPKNANIIELDDDDDEVVIQSKWKKGNNVSKPPVRPLSRTGEKKNQSVKAPIEILDSPELILKDSFGIEEEKDGATTNATNMTNFDDINENVKDGESKDETLDLFDLNIDDLGIKILGEVFLCTKCQKEIPQKDVDKGFQEICASCSKKQKPKTTGNNRKNKNSTKEESMKFEQEPSTYEAGKDEENKNKYDILAPVYQTRQFYEDVSSLDIMNHNQTQKETSVGKTHQTSVLPLNIYFKGKKKKMKKLWNPEKLEHSIYEKFRNDVNGKNSVYLLDEEITEILVRFKYNIEQALSWSMKSNPEFQPYVKKSANRRRIMTRGTGRGYSNIYE